MRQAFFGSLLLLFTACSPRVGTMATKTYPPLNADSPVVVYLYQTDIPQGTESLGKVKVSDTGVSTKCDSVTVINLIKNEARKIGGNAVCITDHIRPSFWGGSCHQMAAILLKVNDSNQSNRPEDNSVTEFTEVRNTAIKSTLPKFKIGANIGYGWRTAKLSSELRGDIRDFYEKMMSGIIWDGSFYYYFNDYYGVGLLYSSYYTSNSIYAQFMPTGETGKLNSKHTITFIGPAFAMRAVTNDQKWIFNLNLGIGYLGYYANETLNSHYLKQDGATVGFLTNLGGEYKFDKHWGVGVDLSLIGGLLRKINIDEDGIKSTYIYKDGLEEGIGQFRLTTGLRYYF